jgi:hypothetical protein
VSFSAPGALASNPTPKYGPSPIGLPPSPMMRAFWSVMSPTAAPTPGTARTRSTIAASIVGRWRLQSSAVSVSNAVLALTTAAVPS